MIDGKPMRANAYRRKQIFATIAYQLVRERGDCSSLHHAQAKRLMNEEVQHA